jgi:Subtilisin inhibitor-like
VRLLAVVALALVAAAPAAVPAATPDTVLRITLWPRGKGPSPYHWTLQCRPANGTLPNRRVACTKLNALSRPFAPVPKGAACTEQFGGPAEATVTGRFEGKRVWAHFNRTDGCRIARWTKHEFLFGGVPLATG